MNLAEFFESGRRRVPGSTPFLGRRPIVSRKPLKFADHFEWLSWDEVDARRRQVGSALQKLFADGTIGGPLKTVGIYSGNCPGRHTLYLFWGGREERVLMLGESL